MEPGPGSGREAGPGGGMAAGPGSGLESGPGGGAETEAGILAARPPGQTGEPQGAVEALLAAIQALSAGSGERPGIEPELPTVVPVGGWDAIVVRDACSVCGFPPDGPRDA
jgi:hypothetical protein